MKRIHFTKRHLHLLAGGIAALAAVAVFYILARNGIGLFCVFYRITGLQCPGCGNSRAALSLLQLDIPSALQYNALFPLEFFYIAWVLFHCAKSYLQGKPFGYKPPCIWLDITVLTITLLWGLLRNII